jgi:hypothetical protein
MCIYLKAVFHPKYYYVHALILLPVEMHVAVRASPPTFAHSLTRYVTLPKYFSHPSFSY